MKTIRDNLINILDMFKTEMVMNHLKSCDLFLIDISTIKGFDQDPIDLISYYRKYLLEKHRDQLKVGILKKITGLIKSKFTRIIVIMLFKKCQSKTFGDGDKYLQEIFLLVRKAI